MLTNLLMLAQEGGDGIVYPEETSALFNLRNLVLVVVLIVVIVGYKIYKNKTMS